MNTKQIQKMAKKDAARWLPAARLQDELANKFERLTGYGEAFDKAFARMAEKTQPVHLKKMNKLRDQLDKMETKKTGARGLLVVAGAYLILNQTGYDKVLVDVFRRTKAHIEDDWAKARVEGRHEAPNAGA